MTEGKMGKLLKKRDQQSPLSHTATVGDEEEAKTRGFTLYQSDRDNLGVLRPRLTTLAGRKTNHSHIVRVALAYLAEVTERMSEAQKRDLRRIFNERK